MFKILVIFSFLVISALATGEFSILHHPSSLLFKGHDHIKESTLTEVYSASLGLSTDHYSNWQGLYIEDPFNLAQALVTVSVVGVSKIDLQKGHHYPLRTDDDDAGIFNPLRNKIVERFPENDNHLVKIDLANGLEDLQMYNIFSGIKDDKPEKTDLNNLKLTIDEDREFLKEITLLHSIAKKIEQGVLRKSFGPDVFWFQVSGLHALSDLHGHNSTATKEAKKLLNDAIFKLNSAFTKAYKGNVLVTVISGDVSQTRRTRNVLQAEVKDDADSHNLSKNYDKDYPVIFNIILWFSVIMVFSIYAICLAIGNMDPGRESIIYRMTSTRIKKDN